MGACESGTFCFWLLVPTTILISVHCFVVDLFLLCMYTTFEYLVGVLCLHKRYNFREIQWKRPRMHSLYQALSFSSHAVWVRGSSKRNLSLKIYGWIYLVQAGTNYFLVDSDFD